jgi:hypothetical protein
MLTLLTLAAVYAGWRIARSAVESLRQLPRRNEDMVLF